MPITLDQIVEETREMPGEVVAELIDRIMVARHGKIELPVAAAWTAETGRRIAEIRQDIRAINVSGTMARALRLEAGAAALKIVRRCLDAAGQAFEVSVTVHPAERISVSMRLQRSGS